MDPVIYLSERPRSDMLLDLSGLTREERVMVQASTTNERDFDRVAEALIIQHPRIHLRESHRQAKGKDTDGFKRVDNPNTRWFRGKGKGKHTPQNSCPSCMKPKVARGRYFVRADIRSQLENEVRDEEHGHGRNENGTVHVWIGRMR